jgi:methyl-accepting chemotaxis protein
MTGPLRSLPILDGVVGFVNSSYRRKLATALLVVLLISGAAALGLYLQIGVLLEDQVEQSMTAAADSEAGELTEWGRQNRLLARVLADHPVYGSGDQAAVRSYLQQQLSDRRESRLVNAYVVDRRRLVVETAATPELEGTPFADLPWEERFSFRTFGDVRITRPHETADGETVVQGFVTPIRANPGHLLIVTVDATSVFDRFEHPVDGGFTRVVDSSGTVVFAGSRDAMLQQYHSGALRAPVLSKGLRGESGFESAPRYEQSNPGNYVVAYAPVEGTDWVVLEHAPAAQAYAVNRQVGVWIGIIFGIVLVGLLGVVSGLGRDVNNALAGLASRAERIERGEYDVAFDTDRPDEFGDLNRTFERMGDTLRERIEEIEETKEALEATNVALETRSTMVSVLNRILRHNVRNDVNSVAGRADLLAERVDDEALREELEVIKRTALALSTLSERTERIQQLLSEDPSERTTLRFPDCLQSPLESVRGAQPNATVTLHVPDDATPVAHGTASFPVALADVVDQLAAHNEGPIRIDVTVSREPSAGDVGDAVLLTIEDDRDGLPDLDLEAVGQGAETPLNHAEGLALWCLEWTVTHGDGELLVDATDATLQVRLPAVPDDPDGSE